MSGICLSALSTCRVFSPRNPSRAVTALLLLLQFHFCFAPCTSTGLAWQLMNASWGWLLTHYKGHKFSLSLSLLCISTMQMLRMCLIGARRRGPFITPVSIGTRATTRAAAAAMGRIDERRPAQTAPTKQQQHNKKATRGEKKQQTYRERESPSSLASVERKGEREKKKYGGEIDR